MSLGIPSCLSLYRSPRSNIERHQQLSRLDPERIAARHQRNLNLMSGGLLNLYRHHGEDRNRNVQNGGERASDVQNGGTRAPVVQNGGERAPVVQNGGTRASNVQNGGTRASVVPPQAHDYTQSPDMQPGAAEFRRQGVQPHRFAPLPTYEQAVTQGSQHDTRQQASDSPVRPSAPPRSVHFADEDASSMRLQPSAPPLEHLASADQASGSRHPDLPPSYEEVVVTGSAHEEQPPSYDEALKLRAAGGSQTIVNSRGVRETTV